LKVWAKEDILLMCFINCTQRQIDFAVGHLLYIS